MNEINFTAAYWHEIENQLATFKSLNNLFKEFDLSLYNNKAFNLLIIFQAYPKDFPAFKAKEYKIMRRKTKILELYLILDYERIMQGTDPENLQHIKEVFLKGCETFLKPLKEFKWEEFNNQIQTILK